MHFFMCVKGRGQSVRNSRRCGTLQCGLARFQSFTKSKWPVGRDPFSWGPVSPCEVNESMNLLRSLTGPRSIGAEFRAQRHVEKCAKSGWHLRAHAVRLQVAAPRVSLALAHRQPEFGGPCAGNIPGPAAQGRYVSEVFPFAAFPLGARRFGQCCVLAMPTNGNEMWTGPCVWQCTSGQVIYNFGRSLQSNHRANCKQFAWF